MTHPDMRIEGRIVGVRSTLASKPGAFDLDFII